MTKNPQTKASAKVATKKQNPSKKATKANPKDSSKVAKGAVSSEDDAGDITLFIFIGVIVIVLLYLGGKILFS